MNVLENIKSYKHMRQLLGACVLFALLILYIPVFDDLYSGVWADKANSHGPIMLALSIFYFLYRYESEVGGRKSDKYEHSDALQLWIILPFAIYVSGRVLNLVFLEAISFIAVIMAFVLVLSGWNTLRKLGFCFFLMLTFVPIPASIVDIVTQPIKIGVSTLSEIILRYLGYPVSRSGVILTVGNYQLLVEDACAGLNSLFTLEVCGLLYINVVKHTSMLRNYLLALLIFPISFASNTIRILILALITYYFGDEVGQSYIHSLMGIILFMTALLITLSIDDVISRLLPGINKGENTRRIDFKFNIGEVCRAASKQCGYVKYSSILLLLVTMVFSYLCSTFLKPQIIKQEKQAALSSVIPSRIGEWEEVPQVNFDANLTTNADGGISKFKIYDDVLLRTYRNAKGQVVMLAIAYAKSQQQDIKIHQPEVCYKAGGFQIKNISSWKISEDKTNFVNNGISFIAMNNEKIEAVNYWVRTGNAITQNGMGARWALIKYAAKGIIPDGALVRVSSYVTDENQVIFANQTQRAFLKQLITQSANSAPGLLYPVLK